MTEQLQAGPKGGLFTPPMWCVLAAAVAFVAAAPAVLIGANQYDSSVFVWMGRRMWAGGLPYRDLWDNKLPVLYWIDALAAVGGNPTVGLWILQSLALALSGCLLYGMGRRLMSEWPARFIAIIYVTFAATGATLMTGNLTENWAAPLCILFVYAMLRYGEPGSSRWLWPSLSGLGLGAATSLRQPALLVGAVALALLPRLWANRRIRVGPIAAWIGGFLLVPAAIVGWAAASGVLRPMIDQCIMFNFAYGTGAPRPGWATWSVVATRFGDLLDQTWTWHVLAGLGLIGLFLPLPAERAAAGGFGRGARPSGATAKALVLFWLVAAAASSLPSLRFYNHHYYLTLAPLSLLAGFLWEPLLGRSDLPAARPRRLIGWAIAIVLVGAVGWHVNAGLAGAYKSARRAAPVRSAAAFIDKAGKPDETVFVFAWGNDSDVLARLNRPSPTKHVMVIFYPELHTGQQMLAEWRDDMLANPPDWLVCREDGDLVTDRGVWPRWHNEYDWNAPQVRHYADEVHAAYRALYEPVMAFDRKHPRGFAPTSETWRRSSLAMTGLATEPAKSRHVPDRLIVYRKKPGLTLVGVPPLAATAGR